MKTWTTQENSIRSTKGTAGIIIRHKTMPIIGVIGRFTRRDGTTGFTYALFRGNAAKLSCYFSARTMDAARAGLEHYWKAAETWFAYKSTRMAETRAKRAALKASDHFTVGDVLTNSWGYDQTNIDFYQVVEVLPRSIKIRPIAQKSRDTGWLQGICQPDRYHFTGEAVLKPLNERGGISFRHGGYSIWDGKPEQWTAYA